MNIVELARKAEIHRIVPMSPALIAALARFRDAETQRCLDIIERRANETGSPPMKSALLSASEEIRGGA